MNREAQARYLAGQVVAAVEGGAVPVRVTLAVAAEVELAEGVSWKVRALALIAGAGAVMLSGLMPSKTPDLFPYPYMADGDGVRLLLLAYENCRSDPDRYIGRRIRPAVKLAAQHKAAVEAIAGALLERGTLDGGEVVELMRAGSPKGRIRRRGQRGS